MQKIVIAISLLGILLLPTPAPVAGDDRIIESDTEIKISLDLLDAAIRKQGYVTGVAAQSLFDKKTGFRDAGYGLDIVDWIMEPGSDEAYRDRLDPELNYQFDNPYHGKTPKRSIEGPQICTQAKRLEPVIIPGKDFVAVTQRFQYRTAAPSRKAGSVWNQTLVFPAVRRYFLSCEHDYRMIIVQKNLKVREKGQKQFRDDSMYLFYITNDWKSTPEQIVFQANDRCQQENILAQLNAVRALHAPLDNLLSNNADMLITSLAWNEWQPVFLKLAARLSQPLRC